MPQRLVTFTTDFGVSDHYVGAMKGVILNINPDAKIVDICNSVASYDVLDGAITISQAYRYFPSDTIHVVIVDPGVGSARRPLVVTTEKHMFLAPDNGVLSFVYEREERLSVRHITSEHFFLQPVSQTFHGRDVFAAVAGWMSKGVEALKLGEEITDFVRLAAPKPKQVAANAWKGIVIKVDKYGNMVTNFHPADLPQLFPTESAAFKVTVGKAEITQLKHSYAEGTPGQLFAIEGSMGFVELATNRGSAAQTAGAGRGAEVTVQVGEATAAAGG